MNTNENVADNIRKQIKQHDMTIAGLADRLGMHRVSLSATLRNGNFQIGTLHKIAEAIGCDITDFFGTPVHRCPHCGEPIEVTLQ